MKWKKNVTVDWSSGCSLCLKGKCMNVKPELYYIVRAMESGNMDEEKLQQLVMKSESCDEVTASLILAQFVLDFSIYMEEKKGHWIIRN